MQACEEIRRKFIYRILTKIILFSSKYIQNVRVYVRKHSIEDFVFQHKRFNYQRREIYRKMSSGINNWPNTFSSMKRAFSLCLSFLHFYYIFTSRHVVSAKNFFLRADLTKSQVIKHKKNAII